MVRGKPAPFVSALVDAVDAVSRAHQPDHAMSVTPRTWLALCMTAVLVTNALGWARFERASRGTSAMAALSWRCRHRTMPWAQRLGARVRVILRHQGLPSGRLVLDDPDHPRSKAAQALAYLDTRRAQDRGGSLWGQRLVWRGWVTPKLALPVGVVCDQPAPESRAWSRTDQALKQQGVPPTQRPRQPAPNPPDPPTAPLALRGLATCKAHHPAVRMHAVMAEARSGTATVVEGASALFRGVPVLAHIRSHQHRRVGTRDQPVADACATQPGTPDPSRIRGGDAGVARVGSARVSVCAHTTTRCIVASTDDADETSRDLIAADLSWRTLARVQGPTRRWLVEVLMPDGTSQAGWSQLTMPPGHAGARQRVILSLLVAQRLFMPPDHQYQRQNHLPADTVGSLRAHVHVECVVDRIDDLVSSEDPQDTLTRFTHALHEGLAFGRSKKHMIQRQWGRLAPPPSLKYRAPEVMRTTPLLST